MQTPNIFARIMKVDESKRLVYGRAAEEVVDKENEVFDYDTSKPNFQKWSADVHADSGGKSYGNIRAMHTNIAAGKVTDIEFLDDDKAIDIVVKIIDNNEWDKVVEGVYTGFSIGGKYARKWASEVNGKMITRYTANPSEISLVDRPCIPTAKFFDVQKRDGTIQKVAFKSFNAPTGATSGMTNYDQEGSKKKKSKKAAPAENAVTPNNEPAPPAAGRDEDDPKSPPGGNAKPKKKPTAGSPDGRDAQSVREPKREVTSKMQKGMRGVACFFAMLRDLSEFACALKCEQEAEDDTSQIFQAIKDKVKELAEIGGRLAIEESTEAADGEDVEMYYGTYLYRMQKALIASELLAKEGRRNSAQDLEMIQAVHDTACKLGAACMSEDADSDEDDDEDSSDDSDSLNMKAENSDMKKSAQSAINSEGSKRGANVTNGDGGGEHSANEDDKERTTAPMGSHGADRGFGSKGRKDEDEDDDDDDDDDSDSDADDDDDSDSDADSARPKKAKKSAKKGQGLSDDAEERITKSVTNSVLEALRELNVLPQKPAKAAPALFATGKDGSVTKATTAEEMKKSVAKVPATQLSGEKDDVATLIKAAQQRPLTMADLYK